MNIRKLNDTLLTSEESITAYEKTNNKIADRAHTATCHHENLMGKPGLHGSSEIVIKVIARFSSNSSS